MRSLWQKNRGFLFPLLITAAILVIITPLPPFVLDMLLSANVTLSVVILLTTIYVRKPLEFSVFPTLLLGTTLGRLVLNVASTRLILTHGPEGTSAAGGVIEAFGEFVAGGSVVIGLIIFSILIAIQFLVITKGATRISEVAARFALDGMPGKQMAIDADLNAQIIKPEQARQRREELGQQADFYGAMDGAGKFVRGDAIAGIVITLINVAGGMYIGIIENQMTASDAAMVFTKLTIGDGLVTQIPAFLISLASGLLVTRTSGDSDLPRDIIGQVFVHPEAMGVGAVFIAALSLTGLPAIPLLSLAGGLATMSVVLSQKKKAIATSAATEAAKSQTEEPPAPPKPEDRLNVDLIGIDVGTGLKVLAALPHGKGLFEQVLATRERLAESLGLILPKVRIRDSGTLRPFQYQISVRDVPMAAGEVYPNALLAMDEGLAMEPLPGLETTDPVFGLKSFWIEPEMEDRAKNAGYNVSDPSSVILVHLQKVFKQFSHELLTRQAVHELLDHLKITSPRLVEELVPGVVKVSTLHQVLRNLLREQVPIRNLDAILEALGNVADRETDPTVLTEFARHALARTISQKYRDRNRVLRVITFDPQLEDIITSGIPVGAKTFQVKLSPQVCDAINRGVAEVVDSLPPFGRDPVVMVSAHIRPALRIILDRLVNSGLAIISDMEATRDTQIESIGNVGVDILNRGRQPALAAG